MKIYISPVFAKNQSMSILKYAQVHRYYVLRRYPREEEGERERKEEGRSSRFLYVQNRSIGVAAGATSSYRYVEIVHGTE